ncbi:hypothetical protein EVAR_54501_1 [Eumeta japonica]|uniref:Uncharacterized protein n=1 Tax=Eumeta variegata TaxID=151549 RepID=A0A4C1YH58_EUMVA|nr:hypothetical protein EVAR_54501_1 [Eumeta japonica]
MDKQCENETCYSLMRGHPPAPHRRPSTQQSDRSHGPETLVPVHGSAKGTGRYLFYGLYIKRDGEQERTRDSSQSRLCRRKPPIRKNTAGGCAYLYTVRSAYAIIIAILRRDICFARTRHGFTGGGWAAGGGRRPPAPARPARPLTGGRDLPS